MARPGLRSVAPVGPRIVLYGRAAERLAPFAVHAAALQMDAGTAEATGLKIPSSGSSRPLHREDEAHRLARGHGPNPRAPPSPPPPRSFHAPSLSLSSPHPSLPPFFFLFTREDREPNQPEYGVWPSGVRGPRLLNKGADWLIDRPSAIPTPHMFPGSLPYIRIPLLASLALAFVKCGV